MNNQLAKALQNLHQPIDYNKGFKYHSVCDNLPNSSLLKENALFNTIKNNAFISFSHQTNHFNQIRQTNILNYGWGCLGPAVYATPIYHEKDQDRRDNFYNLVLSHRDKTKLKEIVINIPTKNLQIYGMNYLLAGEALYSIALNSEIAKTTEFETIINETHKLIKSENFQDILNHNSSPSCTINQLSALAQKYVFFSYLYYESVSQVIMLSANDPKTKNLSKQGEFNANCYYGIIKEYRGVEGERFSALNFTPNYNKLIAFLNQLQTTLNLNFDVETASLNISKNIKSLLESLKQNETFDTNIIGQLLKEKLSLENRNLLMTSFNQALNSYRINQNIFVIMNTATFKPEFGILDNKELQLFTADHHAEKFSVQTSNPAIYY